LRWLEDAIVCSEELAGRAPESTGVNKLMVIIAIITIMIRIKNKIIKRGRSHGGTVDIQVNV